MTGTTTYLAPTPGTPRCPATTQAEGSPAVVGAVPASAVRGRQCSICLVEILLPSIVHFYTACRHFLCRKCLIKSTFAATATTPCTTLYFYELTHEQLFKKTTNQTSVMMGTGFFYCFLTYLITSGVLC